MAGRHWDQGLEVWDTGNWTRLTLTNVRPFYSNVAFTPDGIGLVFVNAWDGPVQLGNLLTGTTTVMASDASNNGGSDSLAISPDGKWLASGCGAGEVRLWDFASRQLLATFPAHRQFVYGLAFSPDSKWLATGGSDQVIHLWEAGSTNQVATFQGHLDEIWSLDFSRDGRTLVSASKDGTARLWDVRSGATRNQSFAIPADASLVGPLPEGASLVTLDPNRLQGCGVFRMAV